MKTSNPPSKRSLGDAEFALRLWFRRFEQEEKNICPLLSSTELLILYAVARGYVFQSRIALLLELSTPTISKNIAKLLSAGLLRQREGDDRRFRTLELTPRAEIFLPQRAETMRSSWEKFFTDITSEDLNAVFSPLFHLPPEKEKSSSALKKTEEMLY